MAWAEKNTKEWESWILMLKRGQIVCALIFQGLLCYPLVINSKYTGKMPLQHDGYCTPIMSIIIEA
jgi:hypothetical protein